MFSREDVKASEKEMFDKNYPQHPQAPPHHGDTPDRPAMTRPALYAEIDALRAELAQAREELAGLSLQIPGSTVHSIVEAYLQKHGYDGLFGGDRCGCEVGNLMPCDSEFCSECRPGYRGPCTCGEGHEFDIHPTKVAIPGWRGEVDDDGDK